MTFSPVKGPQEQGRCLLVINLIKSDSRLTKKHLLRVSPLLCELVLIALICEERSSSEHHLSLGDFCRKLGESSFPTEVKIKSGSSKLDLELCWAQIWASAVSSVSANYAFLIHWNDSLTSSTPALTAQLTSITNYLLTIHVINLQVWFKLLISECPCKGQDQV